MNETLSNGSTPLDPDFEQVALSPDDLELGVHKRHKQEGDLIASEDKTGPNDLTFSGPPPKLASKSFFTWPVAIWFIMSSEFCERFVDDAEFGLRSLSFSPLSRWHIAYGTNDHFYVTLPRFSFYGLKAILPVYLNKYLTLEEETATLIIHLFIFGACM
jgi:hypothetical protein